LGVCFVGAQAGDGRCKCVHECAHGGSEESGSVFVLGLVGMAANWRDAQRAEGRP
jgi:hypothetical protein